MNNFQVFLVAGIIFFSCILGHFLAHEQAHIQIFSYYGTKSSLIFNFGEMKLQVVPNAGEWVSQDVYLPHSINEAVGYQLAPLFVGVMGLQLVQIFVVLRLFK